MQRGLTEGQLVAVKHERKSSVITLDLVKQLKGPRPEFSHPKKNVQMYHELIFLLFYYPLF